MSHAVAESPWWSDGSAVSGTLGGSSSSSSDRGVAERVFVGVKTRNDLTGDKDLGTLGPSGKREGLVYCTLRLPSHNGHVHYVATPRITTDMLASEDSMHKLENAYRAVKLRLADARTMKGVCVRGAGYGSGANVLPLNDLLASSFFVESAALASRAAILAEVGDAHVVDGGTWPLHLSPTLSAHDSPDAEDGGDALVPATMVGSNPLTDDVSVCSAATEDCSAQQPPDAPCRASASRASMHAFLTRPPPAVLALLLRTVRAPTATDPRLGLADVDLGALLAVRRRGRAAGARRAVLERQGGACAACGVTEAAHGATFVVDHFVPLAVWPRGDAADYTLGALTALCAACNDRKTRLHDVPKMRAFKEVLGGATRLCWFCEAVVPRDDFHEVACRACVAAAAATVTLV